MSAPRSELEVIAEAFVEMFEQRPELLPAIQRILAQRAAAAFQADMAQSRVVQDLRVEREIEAILEVLVHGETENQELWLKALAPFERDHPELVQTIKARIQHSVVSFLSKENYANRLVHVVEGERSR
jgi:hypothetical protein